MDNTTIIAIVMLGCVFIIMIITIIKEGTEAAIKIWGVMGALTGVGFGGIVSYYFTNASNQAEIRLALQQKEAAVIALDNIAFKASEANKFVIPIKQALEGKEAKFDNILLGANIFQSVSKDHRLALAAEAELASSQLKEIEKYKEKINPFYNNILPKNEVNK